MDYNDWLKYRSNLAKRDISRDEDNYDLKSYYDSLKYNPGEAGKYDPKTTEAHLPDTYKKPNHPTFSKDSIYSIPSIQEGGKWTPDSQGKWSFKPSDLNLQNKPAEQMQEYFDESDPTANLDLSEKSNMIRRSALDSILKK